MKKYWYVKNSERRGFIIPRRDRISVKLDYLSIVFDTLTAKEVIRTILTLPFEFFSVRKATVKYKKYQNLYQCGTIMVFGDMPSTEDNPEGLGSYLVLGGMGCDDYQSYLQASYENYGTFFRRCEKYAQDRYHLTRLDIAIDDRNEVPYFTVEQIQKKCIKGEYISSSKSYRFAESSFLDGTAKTVYIGDGKSNLCYRFYDKDKEMCGRYTISYDDMESWKRTEIQLRDEKVHAFSKMLMNEFDELGRFTFELLGSNLRFVVKDMFQQNKSRWKTCEFWRRFLGVIKPLKMEIENPMNSLKDTQKWLQLGGALSAVKLFVFLQHHDALGNLEEIEWLMKTSYYSPILSNKAIAHLMRMGRQELIPFIYQETKGIEGK